MKLLILFCLITSFCSSQEITFYEHSSKIYTKYQIIEIKQQQIEDELEAVALNKKEIQEGKYWIDGRWVEKKNSNYIRLNNNWFYKK